MRRRVEADALLFLDGDDWLAPDALRLLIGEPWRKMPVAVAVHAPFAFVAAEASPAAPGTLDRRAAPRVRNLLPKLMLGNLFANGGHVLIRMAAWSAAGRFREDLSFVEDWEFWLRLALQGPFLALGGPPLLFVRRRAGSMMHRDATRMEAYRRPGRDRRERRDRGAPRSAALRPAATAGGGRIVLDRRPRDASAWGCQRRVAVAPTRRLGPPAPAAPGSAGAIALARR